MYKCCDFCGRQIGIRKLRYKEGYLCKHCYAILSNQYKNVIRNKTKKELLKIYNSENSKLKTAIENFEITKRIGNYLLIDEKNRRICIPNNRSVVGRETKPCIYDVEKCQGIAICTIPTLTNYEMELKMQQKSNMIIQSITVNFQYLGKISQIVILNKPVRIKSFAFKKTLDFAKRVEKNINDLRDNYKRINT